MAASLGSKGAMCLTSAVAPTGTGSNQSLQGCNEWGYSKETLVTSTFDYTTIEIPRSNKLKILYWGKKKGETHGWVETETCKERDLQLVRPPCRTEWGQNRNGSIILVVGEMAQCLRALLALPEDPG